MALLLGRGHGTARLIRVFSRMRRLLAASLVLLTCIALPRAALSAEWATFADGRGTSVQYPRDVFSVPGPEGTPAGPVLQSADGRSRLHVFTLANERRASPAEFIRRAVTDDTGGTFHPDVPVVTSSDPLGLHQAGTDRDGALECAVEDLLIVGMDELVEEVAVEVVGLEPERAAGRG